MTRRIILWGGAALLAVLLLLAGLAWAVMASYGVYPPKANYPTPHNLAEAQRDDLDYLRHFLTLDWSYTDRTRALAAAEITRAQSHVPMSAAEFDLEISRVAALADNGHTNISPSRRANRHNRLPLRLMWFADGLYIVRALPDAQPYLGGRVIAVDGRPVEKFRLALRAYTGGADNYRDVYGFPLLMESPELLHAAGLIPDSNWLILTVAMPDGTTQAKGFQALPADAAAQRMDPSEAASPVPIAGEPPGWKPALGAQAQKMLLFASPNEPFTARAMPSVNGYYVRFNQNAGDGTHDIGAFTAAAMTAMRELQPRNIVIDMRFNGGGDYLSTASFMRRLPTHLPHSTIYVLMSAQTFSAGMTSTAFLKQAGGSRTVLVGAPPGDRIRFNAEGGNFCLPNSKICLWARTAVHDYSTARCRPLNKCFAINWFYPVAIKNFEPEIAAPLTFQALAGGHDPALEAIFPGKGF